MIKQKRKQVPKLKQKFNYVEIQNTLDNARIGKIYVGATKLDVPGFMPILTGPEDLKALLKREIPMKELHGLVLELHNADRVLRVAKQFDGSALIQDTMKWRDLKKGKPLLFDPIPEIFYLAKPQIRKTLSEMAGAPSTFFNRMMGANTGNHTALWNTAIEEGEYVGLLTWLKQYQMGKGAPMVVPLTPFIDGKSKSGSINSCLNANLFASEFYTDILDVPYAMYFGINYTAFKSQKATSDIFNKMYEHLQSYKPNALIFRIRTIPNAEGDDKSTSLANIGNFFETMGNLGGEYKIPTLLFNGGTYGLPAIEYGFDSFTERLSGYLGDPIEYDPDPDSGGIPKERQYGKVYHPKWKINQSYPEYLGFLANNKTYPKVSHSTAPNPNETTPAFFRIQAKHFRAGARSDEVNRIIDGINKQNPRGLAEEFSRSKAVNTIKVLKNPL